MVRRPFDGSSVGSAIRPRPDFGIPRLRPEWRALFSARHLREDLVAGATVAAVAIPLSLAIAVASEVPPELGLVSAIVGSIVVALFNGTPLAVSGPAAAMAILVGTVVEAHGLGGLVFAGLVAGALQLLTGVLGLGRLVRLVPSTVVHGFTAGIGAIIVLQQLPRALGFAAPDEAHVLGVLFRIGHYVRNADPQSVGVAALVIAIAIGVPRISKRLPAVLLAVIVPTALVGFAGWSMPTIGALPASLPAPSFPAFDRSAILPLLGDAFVIYLVASLETLLSSAAVDKMAQGQRHDPDQELIGQGIGNLATSALGGIVVTGVIARSALNVQSGAKTRRAAIVSGVGVLFALLYLGGPMSRIPMAALAGVLLVVGARMLGPSTFLQLLRASRTEAAVYAITFATIVVVDLLAGVQAGIAAALLVAAVRLGRSRSTLHVPATGPTWLSLRGPLTFLASIRIDMLRDQLESADLSRGIVVDLGAVSDVDASGTESLASLVDQAERAGAQVALLGARPLVREALLASADREVFERRLAATAAEIEERFHGDASTPGHARLRHGVSLFRSEHRAELEGVFRELASAQKPHTLFYTCADSRISPSLITGTSPGEIFVMRNVGALVPPEGAKGMLNELTGLRYAVDILGVRNIVLCGHSNCGAAQLLFAPGDLGEAEPFASFRRAALRVAGDIHSARDAADAARRLVPKQLENLLSHRFVRERIERGELTAHAWFYDVGAVELYEWDVDAAAFVPVREDAA